MIRARMESHGLGTRGPRPGARHATVLTACAAAAFATAALHGATVLASAHAGRAVLASAASAAAQAQASREYEVRGMVLAVAPDRTTMTVSHDDVPGLMSSMTMPFDVRAARDLDGVRPGSLIEFALVTGPDGTFATRIGRRAYASREDDPEDGTVPALPPSPGAALPPTVFRDQAGRQVTLETFRGRTILVSFADTRCGRARACPRLMSHLTALQGRLAEVLGRDLVLLTVSLDPGHDTPEVLARYAASVGATTPSWRFLTGEPGAVLAFARALGVRVSPSGDRPHTLVTAVVDGNGRLAAHIEGNAFDAQQLGDLVLAVLGSR